MLSKERLNRLREFFDEEHVGRTAKELFDYIAELELLNKEQDRLSSRLIIAEGLLREWRDQPDCSEEWLGLFIRRDAFLRKSHSDMLLREVVEWLSNHTLPFENDKGWEDLAQRIDKRLGGIRH